jgi:hypothetical protein
MAARAVALFSCAALLLLGLPQRPVLPAQKLLSQRRQFIVRQLPLLIELHFRLGRLAAAPLPLLGHVPLVVGHPILHFLAAP